MKQLAIAILGVLFAGVVVAQGAAKPRDPVPAYELSFASFGPLNTDIFIADADGRNARPWLPHAAQDYNASFSRDGQWVCFTSERSGSADIYRAHPDGSGLERLTDHPAFDDQAAVSPNGEQIAFVSTRSGTANIWTLNLKTRALRNLTNQPAGHFRPSWSPDGQWIAFSSDRDSLKPRRPSGFEIAHSVEVYVMRADGSELRRLTSDKAFVGSPVWSEDGKSLIVFDATLADYWSIVTPRRERGNNQISAIDVQTGAKTVLSTGRGEKWSPKVLAQGRIGFVSGGPERGVEFTSGPAGARGEFNNPQWSADGRFMVFDRETETRWPPNQEWASLDPLFKLRRTGVFAAYSPSGQRLVSNDKRGAVQDNSILGMDRDGTNIRVLYSELPKSAVAPVWSPKGDMLAFSIWQFIPTSFGKSLADLAIMNADGSGLTLLTQGDGNYSFPNWSPDGKKLVYRQASADKGGLRIRDLETGQDTVLTTHNHDNLPSWSVQGLIAFTSFRDGDYEIYTIRPDGSQLKRLTHSPGNEAHNAWSPDGQWLAFVCAHGGFKDEGALHPRNPQAYGEICVMRADGSDRRVLTDNPYEKGTPHWIPASAPAAGAGEPRAVIPPLPEGTAADKRVSLLVPDPVPAKARLIEKSAVFDGVQRSWFEYVPPSYDGTRAVPLVVAVHGGSADGAWMFGASSWAQIADQLGFIVIYPNGSSGTGKRLRWNAYPEFNRDPRMAITADNGVDEAGFFKQLIEQTARNYKIDTTRVYMHGQSNGGIMTSYFALRYPGMLAAAAACSAPPAIDVMAQYPAPKLKLPMYWWHGEADTVKDQYNPANKLRSVLNSEFVQFWAGLNGSDPNPALRLDGPYNTLVHGGTAEVRSTEFRAGVHSLPYTSAYLIWNDFFSRYARAADGSVVQRGADVAQAAPADPAAIALKLGAPFAWVAGKVVPVGTTPRQAPVVAGNGAVGLGVLVPARFAVAAFGAELSDGGGNGVTLRTAAGSAVFTAGASTAMVNGKPVPLDALSRQVDGEWMVSLKVLAVDLQGKVLSVSGMNAATGPTMPATFNAPTFGAPAVGGVYRNDVVYVADRAADLSGQVITLLDQQLDPGPRAITTPEPARPAPALEAYRPALLKTLDTVYAAPAAAAEAERQALAGRKVHVYTSSKANYYTPSPMVLLLAPSGQDPVAFARQTGWLDKAEAERLVLVLPVAAGDDLRWRLDSAELAYLKAAYDTVRRATPDPVAPAGRNVWLWEVLVSLVGYKEGATLGGEFALRHPARFAAVALVGGTPWSDYASTGALRTEHPLVPKPSADYTLRNQDVQQAVWLFGEKAADTDAAAAYWRASNAPTLSLQKQHGDLASTTSTNLHNAAAQVRVTHPLPAFDRSLTQTLFDHFLAHTVRWKNAPDGTLALHMPRSQVEDIGGRSPYRRGSFRLAGESSDRAYYVYTPRGWDGRKPLPVLISLHGRYEPQWIFSDKNGWNEQADQHGFIVVYPNAPLRNSWDVSGPASSDIRAFPVLIEKIKSQYAVDASRIYLHGFSLGSATTYAVGMVYPELFAGISGWSGLSGIAADLEPDFWSDARKADPATVYGQGHTKLISGGVRLPVFTMIGDSDNIGLPFAPQANRGAPQKFMQFWISAAGAAPVAAVAPEDGTLFYKPSSVVDEAANSKRFAGTGNRMKTYVFAGPDGVDHFRFTVMKNTPHGAIPAQAAVTWDFLKHFSRVHKGAAVVYTKEVGPWQ